MLRTGHINEGNTVATGAGWKENILTPAPCHEYYLD